MTLNGPDDISNFKEDTLNDIEDKMCERHLITEVSPCLHFQFAYWHQLVHSTRRIPPDFTKVAIEQFELEQL